MQRQASLLGTISLLFLSTLFPVYVNLIAKPSPVASPLQNNIVISEFRTRGDDGVYDEFIELFNPTGAQIDIGGWFIMVSAGCSTSTSSLITITPSTKLAPGQHYMLASETASVPSSDQTWSSSPASTLWDNGGIALFDPAQVQPIDSVGMCATTLYVEGDFLFPLTSSLNRSYERLPGGNLGNCVDTDDNRDDFQLVQPGNPQSASDSFTTSCIPSVPTLTYTNTYTPLPPENLVISEFRTRGTNGEDDEFIEIFNPSPDSVQLGGWQVWRSSGCGMATSQLFSFPENVWLPPGHHFLAASVDASISISPDLVYLSDLYDTGGFALINRSGKIIDQVGMCTTTKYHEGTPLEPLVENLDQSFERKLGGTEASCYDTGDNTRDFSRRAPGLPQNLDSPPVFCPGILTSTPVFTPTYPGNATHIVISEFRTRGFNGPSDELIELYNPTGSILTVGGWTIKKSSGCGSTISSLVTITTGMFLLPGQHYLLLSSITSSLSGADQVFSPGIDDDGGIAVLNTSNIIVDQVGMCATTAYREGAILDPMFGNIHQSYERKLGGPTSCQDTNNNLYDFFWASSSTPQNRLSPIVPCMGVLTETMTFTPTKSRTPTRTKSATPTFYPGVVVINEYLPRPASDWNGSGEANSRDEFIELMNMGVTEINIKNWKLDDMADGGSDPYTLPDLILSPLQIVRFYASETGISLSDGGDSVRLLKPDGRTADSHNYTIVTVSDQSWCRLPDGSGGWVFNCRPTPGRPNIVLEVDSGPPVVPGAGYQKACFLPDTAPQAIWLAECRFSGLQVWKYYYDLELWIKTGSKWGLFVK